MFYATILNIKCEENQESNADVQYFYIMLQYIKQVAIGQNLFARNYQTEIKKWAHMHALINSKELNVIYWLLNKFIVNE